MRAMCGLARHFKGCGAGSPDIRIRLAAFVFAAAIAGCSSGGKSGGQAGAGGQAGGPTGGAAATSGAGAGRGGGSGGIVGSGGGHAGAVGSGGDNRGTGGSGAAGGTGGCSGSRPSGGCVGAYQGVCYPDPIEYVCGTSGEGWICPAGTFPPAQCTCSGTPRASNCPFDAGTNDGGAPSDGAAADGSSTTRDARPASDAAICSSISADYAAALRTAQECTVGASNQCQSQVRAGFFCNCTTFANMGADLLSAIATRYADSGCLTVCGGVCVLVRAASCMPDTSSALGGRCKPTDVLSLSAAEAGGTYNVAVGNEIDINLESPAPGSYGTTVTLSSPAASILEVTIPAGPANTNGPTRLYRLRAVSSGMVTVGIPFEPNASGSPRPNYTATINIR